MWGKNPAGGTGAVHCQLHQPIVTVQVNDLLLFMHDFGAIFPLFLPVDGNRKAFDVTRQVRFPSPKLNVVGNFFSTSLARRESI